MNNILIRDCRVLPMTEHGAEKYFRGSVGISDGKIAFASAEKERADEFARAHGTDLRIIEGGGKLVMPGLINAHNHIAMTLMRSYADDLPLMRWLNEYIWPFEAKMTRDDVRLGAEFGMAEMLLGGTTTSADMYWMDEAVGEAAEKTGIRAVLSSTVIDGRISDFDKDFRLLYERYGNGRHPRITLGVSPHAVYTCSPETLLHTKELADRYDLGIIIHISETQDEQRMIREQYGKTPVEVLRDLGMLNPKTLIVHAVYVSESDIEIMKEYGVSVAHNPQSNMKLASGIAPVAAMIAAGVNVSIGTDGSSSNNDLDMWDEMRSASFLQKVSTLDPCVLPAWDVLKMATVNGAKALGLEGKTGQIAPGMAADVIILDIEKPHLYPQTDMVANLVYCAKSSDVETVIVDGRIVVDGGKLLTVNAMELCHKVQARFDEIRKR